MKFTQIRNIVKMLLKELNMPILQFVVIIFYNIYGFTYLQVCFFFTIFTIRHKPTQKTKAADNVI